MKKSAMPIITNRTNCYQNQLHVYRSVKLLIRHKQWKKTGVCTMPKYEYHQDVDCKCK